MNRLSAMEAFVRVIETGSFSGAARLLRIGQPAVSKAIAQIEARLGVRLLVCTTRGLIPTRTDVDFPGFPTAAGSDSMLTQGDSLERGNGWVRQ